MTLTEAVKADGNFLASGIVKFIDKGKVIRDLASGL